MGVSKTDGTGAAPVAQPEPEVDANEAAPAEQPASDAAPQNEPLVKRWQPTEVPAAVSGNATVFETKSGGGPAPAAAAKVDPAKGPSGPAPGSYPTVADTQRIAANSDGAARNLDITQAYGDLSKAMGQVVGS